MELKKNVKLNDTYTLIEEIGSGGGGIVYKAYHENLKTYVVVKKIRDRVKGKLEERAEADILKKMKHTYLPRVYDFLEIDGDIYTVIDYIPGKSLDKVLEEKALVPQSQVLKWLMQLAEALDYLHRQTPPVIHSDIKPANIMLTPEGNICLIDFNISLAFDKEMRNSAGISRGYSPPEQYHDLSFYRKLIGTETPQKSVERKSENRTETACSDEGQTMSAATVAGETVAAATMSGETETMAAAADPDETVAAVAAMEAAKESAANETVTAAVTESIIESTIGRGIDTRSDIYSLGATVYHLLTGIRPSREFEKLLPISQCDVEISEGLSHIVEKMLEIDPQRRYQNGSELLYALQHIYDLDSEYRAYHRKERGKRIAVAALYLAGAVLIGSGNLMINNAKNVRYHELVELADQAIQTGEYAAAEAAVSEAEELIPDRVEAYSKEALLLYHQGRYEDCISYASRTIQDAPYQLSGKHVSLGDLYYILGNAYLETEDYANAVLNLETAIEEYDSNSLYYRDYAISLAKTGKIDAAESALDRAIRLGLGEDSVYMVQGEISFAKTEYQEAEACLLQAIQTAESDSLRKRAVLLCAKVYRSLGADYLDKEIALLEQEENQYAGSAYAMNFSERLADAYARKAKAAGEEGSAYYEKALERFQNLYEGGYATRQMLENIAILYQQMNEFEKAKEQLLQMTEQYPESYEGYKRLAVLEADEQQSKANADRDYIKMREYYEKAKELYGDRDDDQEMQMLDVMIRDLQSGNWL